MEDKKKEFEEFYAINEALELKPELDTTTEPVKKDETPLPKSDQKVTMDEDNCEKLTARLEGEGFEEGIDFIYVDGKIVCNGKIDRAKLSSEGYPVEKDY